MKSGNFKAGTVEMRAAQLRSAARSACDLSVIREHKRRMQHGSSLCGGGLSVRLARGLCPLLDVPSAPCSIAIHQVRAPAPYEYAWYL